MKLKTATMISMVGIALSIVLLFVARANNNKSLFLICDPIRDLSILFFLACLYKKQN